MAANPVYSFPEEPAFAEKEAASAQPEPQSAAERYPLAVLTNLPGTELRFESRADLVTFATIASGRVATSLEVLLKQVDDHLLAVALENIADLAFQVHGCVNALVAREGAVADPDVSGG